MRRINKLEAEIAALEKKLKEFEAEGKDPKDIFDEMAPKVAEYGKIAHFI
jgi:predicted nuclease with TOPRIM domain